MSTAIGAANAVAKNSLVRDLLGPLAKAYGADWGERAKERLEAAKAERRAKNLEAHVANAEREVPLDDLDPAILEQWAVAVSEVDPLDEQLSNAWRAAIKAVASHNPYREKILRLLKSMTPDEVYQFIGRRSFYGLPAEYRDRFVDLGLCQPFKERILQTAIMTLPIGLMLAALTYFFLPRGLDLRGALNEGDRTASYFIASSLTLGWAVGATALMIWMLRVPIPTRLGVAFWSLSRSTTSLKVTVLAASSESSAEPSRNERKASKASRARS
ncbi:MULTISPECIES: hypothetical protein [unclassified Bosea (in: a-proteobacteria)]|uniref:hypothetical protein n=1 Tax=unclassified Bosea (in: a-proteobacteria) TaxID=2653178 RepID=UPI000F7F8CB9|nr:MULTISPECIES: hypothetical protein [unclassified Bosea (in: a-proteobacteria)]